MLGSVIVLDRHGFRTQASELQRLLQPIPHALRPGGSDSDQKSGIHTGGVETLSLAGPLSWVIPNADCRLSRNSPWTAARTWLSNGAARPRLVRVAATLSRTLSDSHCRVIFGISRPTGSAYLRSSFQSLNSIERFGDAVALDVQIVRCLQVQPESLGCTEKSGQTQCCV